MATIRVHTTQNVTIEYNIASIGDRIVATLIDYLVLTAWGAACVLIVMAISSNSSSTSHPVHYSNLAELIGAGIAILLGFILLAPFLFYNLVCEVFFNGQSLGKKARDIRVIRLDGTAPRLGDYFLRWLLRLIDFGFGSGVVAVIAIAASGKGQRLGDMAAGTTVISLKPQADQLYRLDNGPTPEGYQVVFPQAAQLTDHDLRLLRQLLGQGLQQQNYILLHDTALKVKSLLNIQTDLGDEPFLRTIMRDHSHLAAMAE
jgi:uncharacterized RDD family membrane protein YckC